MRTYWLQVTAAVDNAPLTVSDATMRGLLTGAKYRFDACENIRHDRPAFSPKRISYVLPPQASAADSSDVTDSQGSSSCAQTSSTLNSDSQVTAMQPCSQQGSDLGVGGVSQGVLTAVTPWAPVAAASGLMALCAQAIKDNGANKEEPQAVPREDIEEIRRKAKEEEARLAPPGSAYVTSSSGDSRMQKTGCQVITMQHYIKAMEQEKQRAREKSGHGDIWEQPMVLVITAEGKMLFWAALPVLSFCVLDCSLAVKALQHKCCMVLRVVMQLIKLPVHGHSRPTGHDSILHLLSLNGMLYVSMQWHSSLTYFTVL